MSARKVAVVTGSNKGIGFALVRGLCKQWDGDVFVTARNEKRGKDSVEALQKEGLSPKFHQLDITDTTSVVALKDFLVKTYGGLDILVNNAGIVYPRGTDAPFTEQVKVTLATNYWATSHVCATLFPILRSHARVVNVSSGIATRNLAQCGESVKSRILGAGSISDVDVLMKEFEEAVMAGEFESKGWPNSAYAVSKIGVTTMSIIQQREFDKETARTDIVVNSCCPGFVNTDMTEHKGHKTPDEGADTPLFLALLPENEQTMRGTFVSERKIVKWE